MTPAPNIRRPWQDHEYLCTGYHNRYIEATPGDVKKCPHGDIMIYVKFDGHWYWRTLHPWLNWSAYRRAEKALGLR